MYSLQKDHKRYRNSLIKPKQSMIAAKCNSKTNLIISEKLVKLESLAELNVVHRTLSRECKVAGNCFALRLQVHEYCP